jgi:hypothetical protein
MVNRGIVRQSQDGWGGAAAMDRSTQVEEGVCFPEHEILIEEDEDEQDAVRSPPCAITISADTCRHQAICLLAPPASLRKAGGLARD